MSDVDSNGDEVVHVDPDEEWQPADELDCPTEETMAFDADEGRHSSALIAIILLVAMGVFACQGDHKDKSFGAMIGQLEAWTGLDFSEKYWGIGGEE